MILFLLSSFTPLLHGASAPQDDTIPSASRKSSGESAGTETPKGLLSEDDRPDSLRAITRSWNTNWNRRIIEYDELSHGGPPRDGIPSIDAPVFQSVEEASTWLKPNEPVIFIEIDEDARVYPIQILIWHEIVNDVIGSTPVLVTFCPLCNSAIVFDRRVDGTTHEYGTSGLLRNSDLVMYDRTTESLWQQLTGEALVGDLTGNLLKMLPASIVSFESVRESYPGSKVLSRDTGHTRSYGKNPYVGYDSVDQSPFLFTGEPDGRLKPMERVVSVSVVTVEGKKIDKAYPYSVLSEEGVINDCVEGTPVAVFFLEGASSALDSSSIPQGRDIGETGVFDPRKGGRVLRFKKEEARIIDLPTESEWNIFGEAISGEMKGTKLEHVVHLDSFWFAWAAFKPDTVVHGK